jgi:hypothetical protein
MSGMGHNNGPALEREVSVRTRWAKSLFADPETPSYVMAIAWAIHWYSRSDGTGAALSNGQLQIICGISPATATRGKAWLRDHGYVQLRAGTGIEKTQFRMAIPVRDGVIREMTLPNQADEAIQVDDPHPIDNPHQRDHPHPNHTDVPHQPDGGGVIREMTNIQERDSVSKKKGGKRDNLWQQSLNPQDHGGVLFENGKLTLLNGERSFWLDQFGGDERRLDLALIQIVPYLQPNSSKPLQSLVSSQLAAAVGRMMDADKRYRKKPAEQAKGTTKRIEEMATAALEKQGRRT